MVIFNSINLCGIEINHNDENNVNTEVCSYKIIIIIIT